MAFYESVQTRHAHSLVAPGLVDRQMMTVASLLHNGVTIWMQNKPQKHQTISMLQEVLGRQQQLR